LVRSPVARPALTLYAPRHWPFWLSLGLLRLVVLLPWGGMMAIGRSLGRLLWRLIPRRVRIADINLRLCFPKLSADQRSDLVRRHFESLGMGVMDLALAWWASDRRIWSLVEVHGRGHLEAAFREGRGVILLTAHCTSMEISGRVLKDLAPVLPLYRPHRNPAIEQAMIHNRERHVEQVIPRGDVRLMVKTLKANKGVWFAPDQNFGHKNSLFSPFFGVRAATNTATSRFAAMTGARVVPFVVLRCEDRPGYHLYIEPALAEFPGPDLQQDTDRINAVFEQWIRRAPAQYLWSHRRFKDRPPGESSFY
jgi:KDO2-lipid IV(A) lauroyltransferase